MQSGCQIPTSPSGKARSLWRASTWTDQPPHRRHPPDPWPGARADPDTGRGGRLHKSPVVQSSSKGSPVASRALGSNVSVMPTTRTLLLTLVVGAAFFVLFAFTVVGLVGEAIVLLSIVGLLLRALAAAAGRIPHG